MKVVACYKVVRDDKDLQVGPDGAVDLSRAGLRVGDYDLNAIEAGAQLAAATSGTLTGLTVGGEEVRDSKVRKGVLSRGVDASMAVVDAGLTAADAETTSAVLAAAVASVAGWELTICGEGSADRYAQQVGAQLAVRLGVPYVNGVSRIEPADGGLTVERVLESEVETLRVPLPAVVSVTSDLNTPRIPSMKDILGAGKKPTSDCSPADLGLALSGSAARVGPEVAPPGRERAGTVYAAAQSAEFFAAVRQLLGKDAK